MFVYLVKTKHISGKEIYISTIYTCRSNFQENLISICIAYLYRQSFPSFGLLCHKIHYFSFAACEVGLCFGLFTRFFPRFVHKIFSCITMKPIVFSEPFSQNRWYIDFVRFCMQKIQLLAFNTLQIANSQLFFQDTQFPKFYNSALFSKINLIVSVNNVDAHDHLHLEIIFAIVNKHLKLVLLNLSMIRLNIKPLQSYCLPKSSLICFSTLIILFKNFTTRSKPFTSRQVY